MFIINAPASLTRLLFWNVVSDGWPGLIKHQIPPCTEFITPFPSASAFHSAIHLFSMKPSSSELRGADWRRKERGGEERKKVRVEVQEGRWWGVCHRPMGRNTRREGEIHDVTRGQRRRSTRRRRGGRAEQNDNGEKNGIKIFLWKGNHFVLLGSVRAIVPLRRDNYLTAAPRWPVSAQIHQKQPVSAPVHLRSFEGAWKYIPPILPPSSLFRPDGSHTETGRGREQSRESGEWDEMTRVKKQRGCSATARLIQTAGVDEKKCQRGEEHLRQKKVQHVENLQLEML